MGAVPAEVVIATFFSFHPDLVRHAIPAAWQVTTPGDLVEARLAAAGAALCRATGQSLSGPDVVRAAGLARLAAEACTPAGRPLYAGHADLPWPQEAHLVLWHAATLLREFRGDGHIACLVEAGLDPVEALVVHAASGEVDRGVLQSSRAWDDDAWSAASDRLAQRGLLDAEGAVTDAGVALRQRVEDGTDAAALAPWIHLGAHACDELRSLVRPLSQAIVASGTFGLR
jgi:hypothetical protein